MAPIDRMGEVFNMMQRLETRQDACFASLHEFWPELHQMRAQITKVLPIIEVVHELKQQLTEVVRELKHQLKQYVAELRDEVDVVEHDLQADIRKLDTMNEENIGRNTWCADSLTEVCEKMTAFTDGTRKELDVVQVQLEKIGMMDKNAKEHWDGLAVAWANLERQVDDSVTRKEWDLVQEQLDTQIGWMSEKIGMMGKNAKEHEDGLAVALQQLERWNAWWATSWPTTTHASWTSRAWTTSSHDGWPTTTSWMDQPMTSMRAFTAA